MSKEATDDNLLSYDDYYKFKEKFAKDYEKNDNLDPDKFLNDTKYMIEKRPTLGPVLEKLLNHIRNNGIFLSYPDMDRACNYISYLLSNEVDSKNYVYETEIFNMFQKFLNEYNHRPSKFNASICSNTLVHVHSEMYIKMKKLYALYELYKNHRGNKQLADPDNCSALGSFLNQFNDFVRIYQPKYRHYKNILDDFKKKIEKDATDYRAYACVDKRFNIIEIKLHTVPVNEKTKESGPLKQNPNHVQYQVPPARSAPSHVEPQAPPAEFQATREAPRTSRAEHRISLAPPETPHEGRHSAQETLPYSPQHVAQQQQQGLPQRETSQREFPMDLSLVYEPRNEALEHSQTLSSPEHYPYSSVLPSSNDVEDTSSSVMNTITRALKDVEPGPVLGVSGGMGVLFLLFKYTPVGSFFGGRRGRFRQIPRTFGGFPPGDFGNFQEYGGGYVGYSQMDMPFQGE
ncbi:unnamed protein product [Plasmodium vivax]|uniref:(malaria parasite P. vivax) hypothetical protein n=1 Tax=Plasmodium vivax TaxID=5855 RepID=A0A8S4H281_PLAVI|nr:unnamed protein product [Plasmodium vivax]